MRPDGLARNFDYRNYYLYEISEANLSSQKKILQKSHGLLVIFS
ncbi:hypothetical Protein YC6258_00367 [Gynuella sunshinyii YC6258]|uniref:Uncharacterized protein n=1 Tax=Gynuella sunshinyii YC6258 TaxID=1445510 RepID=A0A0C5VD16_9GAMM|nr:hypothetical Protein YC6258_00367 [Gynuella sunshinyii YC6258]